MLGLSEPCDAGHAHKLTINGTAFTVATVRIVGHPETGHPTGFEEVARICIDLKEAAMAADAYVV